MTAQSGLYQRLAARIIELFSRESIVDLVEGIPHALASVFESECRVARQRPGEGQVERPERALVVRLPGAFSRGAVPVLTRGKKRPGFTDEERSAVELAAELISDEIARRRSRGQLATFSLTRREIDVVDAVARGMSNRRIAGRLRVSEATVKRHLYNIFNKTGCDSRTQLLCCLAHGRTPGPLAT